MERVFLPILLGTTRQGRASEQAARFIVREAEARSGIETQLFDVRDFHFPSDNYGQSTKDNFPEWRDAIARADGLIIVTPEYNHGYPGTLKSALDTLLPEYLHKAVGFVSVSSGSWGGTRVIENLLPVVRELRLVASRWDLQFPNAASQFDEDGNVTNEEYRERAKLFLDQLVWLAKTLRWGRENIVIE